MVKLSENYILKSGLRLKNPDGSGGFIPIPAGLIFVKDKHGNFLNTEYKVMLRPITMQDLIAKGIAVIAIV